MYVKCSKGSILQYFRPSLSYHLSLRSLFCLFFEWPLKTGFSLAIHLLSDTKKLGQGHIESDSDLGIMTGDTDNEGPEVVMPVQPGEATLSGVEMETAESEDEITQIEDTKVIFL